MTTAKFKIESGVQLLARLSKKPEIENFYPVLFDQGLKYGNVVEIISCNNSSYLLIDMICDALIKTETNAESVGVLMFNTAGHFNIHELIKTLEKRIELNFNSGIDKQILKKEIDKVLEKTLSNFFLFEIYDATQFYTTIYSLDNIFTKHSNISLLLFDTVTAFYWSEQGFKITKMDVYLNNLLGIIQKVTKEYKVILVYTRPAYFSSSKDTADFETSEITDGVNFKVKLDNKKEVFEVNVKTLDSYYKKCFQILDNIIKWQ